MGLRITLGDDLVEARPTRTILPGYNGIWPPAVKNLPWYSPEASGGRNPLPGSKLVDFVRMSTLLEIPYLLL